MQKSFGINKLSIITLFYLISLTLVFPIYAADSLSYNGQDDKNHFEIFYDDILTVGKDALYVGNEIISADKNDFLMFAGVAGLTGLGLALDEDMRSTCLNNNNKFLTNYFDVTNQFGDKYYAIIMTGSLYTGGLITGSDEVRITARMMFESLILSAYTTTVLKMIFGRARPYMEEGRFGFEWFEATNNYNSFPSGHTTVAFSLASVAARRIDAWWAYTLFFSSASFTGIARMYKDQHWLSDVILGAAVGTTCGFMIVDARRREKCRKGKEPRQQL